MVANSLAQRLGLLEGSELLATALTHSSFAAENSVESNERLEFLGDAVVDLAITDAIIRRYPELHQGTGSLTRSKVVNEASLADAARRLDLGEYVVLGRGELKSLGAERSSLLADAFEAVVAAVYLERGYDVAADFVLEHLGDALETAAASPDELDPKSQLRQWCEARAGALPSYEVVADGPSHAANFSAVVFLDGAEVGRGTGRSKKQAEAAAAANALESLSA